MKQEADSVAIVSGGLDSTTLVYEMREQGYVPHLLSFDYGQRHKKELQYARMTAKKLDLMHDVVDLTRLTHLISRSALTAVCTCQTWPPDGPSRDCPVHGEYGTELEAELSVPEGHYAEDNMRLTVVPNRNMIMLAIAAGVAVNNRYRVIGTGVHAGDHAVYPDCRPEFIYSVGRAILDGNEGFSVFDSGLGGAQTPILAPFLYQSKQDIAYRALELVVPLHMTWSCYKGGEKHCGRCGTCVERLEAIDGAISQYNADPEHVRVKDYTEYEDAEFWKVAIREASRQA